MAETEQDELENLGNYFRHANEAYEREKDWPDFPLNDEYCWSHHDRDGQYMGGWTCQHEDCRGETNAIQNT